ncbi:hypothetical protein Tco_1211111 [Tanacetum coccineum]
MSTLDEGLYALACDGDIRCLTTLVRSFKLVKKHKEHGFTVVNSYQMPPPHVRATMEDISQPGSSATIEYRSDKMVLKTWHDSSTFVEEIVYDFVTPRFMPQHDSSTPAKNSICEFITPRCMPQHGSNTPVKDSICESVTPRCMPHGMLTPPIDESVIEDVMRQLSFEETKLDGDAGYGDVAGGGMDSYGLSRDESFGFDDLDLNVRIDESLVVGLRWYVVHGSGKEDDEQGNSQEAVEETSGEQADYDVDRIDSAYETYKDILFDNIGVTSLVLEYLQEYKLDEFRREMEVLMNASGRWMKLLIYTRKKFARSKEANDRACLNSIESRRMLKLYKNDKIRVEPYQIYCSTDLMFDNICEVFNGKIVGGRDKSIITLLEYIKEYCMKRIVNVQGVIDKCTGPLTPTTTRIMEAIKKETHLLKVQWNGGVLEKFTCPTTLLPPNHVQIGKPKKKRKRSKLKDEPFVKHGKLSKKGRTINCQSCGNIRHNKATCKGQGGNNAEASASASGQAQQAKHVVG